MVDNGSGFVAGNNLVPTLQSGPTTSFGGIELNPFAFDTWSIRIDLNADAVLGANLQFAGYLYVKPIKEGLDELIRLNPRGALNRVLDSQVSANVDVAFSLGAALDANWVLTFTGSDGSVLDQRGVKTIGWDNIPLNYGLCSGACVVGSTMLDAYQGRNTSQSWGVGEGAGAEISVDLAQASDSVIAISRAQGFDVHFPFYDMISQNLSSIFDWP